MYQHRKKRNLLRKRRVFRVRKHLKGCSTKPRLSVFRSLNHIGAQLIDDEKGVTLVGFITISKEIKGQKKSKESARLIGQKIAELAKEKNIGPVIFDRGRFRYHGLIAELADAARKGGLIF